MSDEMEALLRWRAKLTHPVPVVLRRPERQCVNDAGKPKARHRTEHAANASRTAIQARPGWVDDPRRPLNVYKCGLCNYWHVGRNPKRQPRPPQS